MHKSIVFFLLFAVTAGAGADLRQHRKPQKIKFRVAATADPIRTSSFSVNHEAFLVNVIGTSNSFEPTKIVFTYTGYGDPLPTELIDYDLVHTFKALRDRSCDEQWASFSMKTQPGPGGRLVFSQAIRFTPAATIAEMSPYQVLPCYVIEARGYQGSKHLPVSPDRLAQAKMEGK